jgi:RNA polymerase sigma-70 factor (ECF subfamily)
VSTPLTGAVPGTRRRTSAAADAGPEPADWVLALTAGPGREDALRRLHALLVRAARHQVLRMRGMLPGAGAVQLEELVQQTADEAMVAVLGKLSTFEGRSRFTTWAYKFALVQAAVEVRSQAWRSRQVVLEDAELAVDLGPSVEAYAEAADLARAVQTALAEALTPHQRRVMLALVVDGVPIDVLAERLGTNRNALYKTLHDARVRVRTHLEGSGHLPPARPRRRRCDAS